MVANPSKFQLIYPGTFNADVSLPVGKNNIKNVDVVKLLAWRYIKTTDNPADISSRGISTKDANKIQMWIHGPEFFWQNETPNVERSLHPTIEEVNGAERLIITTTQQVKFTDEIAALQKQNHVSEHSPISSLNPFIDESGVLRVGGRLRRSNLNFQLRHPILLPKNHELSESIVRWCHEKCAHRGRLHTLHELRNHGFWVVNGNTFVRKIIYHCVICCYLRGSTSNQIMADLPKARVVESPPFTYVGVDFFGPFIVKELRRELKRYGVIFTCFSTRPVHLEVSSSLETDTFIMTLRRFISRRGKVRSMHSDNGTNFVGTERELKKAISEMDHERIAKYMNEQDGDWIWKFNPPASSHMGGVWERHIRSIRRILAALLKSQGPSLNTETLTTLLVEVESIINSRPLTVDTVSDPTEPMALSPMNLLTMKSKVVLPPPGEFDESDLYSRKRWRRIQFLANEFWERWRKEYLFQLQHRTKWRTKEMNFRSGDIVLLKDNTLTNTRNDWLMGTIEKVYPDDTGTVRSVDCRIGKNVYRRPITKLVLLIECSTPDEEPSDLE
ncbi:uncharacterized protein [Clytia hemisphaerica]|uniref:uncharacterized protein n=1 Tax=Clytia hemisphaerica TaxID=252671 RepID=UPI0034D66722